MNPTTIKYGLIGLTLLASHGALAYVVSDYKERGHRAAIAEQKAEAERTLTAVVEANRKKEQEDAESARNIDAVYQAMLNDAYAGSADFDKRLRDARRRQSGSCPPGGEAVNPRISPDVAPGSDDGSRGIDPASNLRTAALELQRYAKTCHAFAISVGR